MKFIKIQCPNFGKKDLYLNIDTIVDFETYRAMDYLENYETTRVRVCVGGQTANYDIDESLEHFASRIREATQ